MTILAAQRWPSNAELLQDVAALWFKPDDVIVDLTYGRGTWWKKYRHPGRVVGCTRSIPEPKMLDQMEKRGIEWRMLHDFRNLGPLLWTPPDHPNHVVDVFLFDPPYVAPGGRSSSTIPDFNDRYGLVDCSASPRELHQHNALGLAQAFLYVRPGGLIVTKSMDYISSGTYQPGTYWMQRSADALGLIQVDRFEHIGNARVQPGGRRQVHARRNVSTMLVYRKPLR